MCATREMPQARKRPWDSRAPLTWPCASLGSVPHTWLTLTPTFSNACPRNARGSPPPCRRWPAGFAQLRDSKRASGSKASNAVQMRACRSPKNATALPDRSLASLMHVIDQARDGLRIGVGPDPVAEVDDVPRRLAGFLEERIDLALQILG